jgi:hypothetical protein
MSALFLQLPMDQKNDEQLGGPAQVPIVKSPRSQKECVNSNYFQNIKTRTDDGQDTHHKNVAPPNIVADPSHVVLQCIFQPTCWMAIRLSSRHVELNAVCRDESRFA